MTLVIIVNILSRRMEVRDLKKKKKVQKKIELFTSKEWKWREKILHMYVMYTNILTC